MSSRDSKLSLERLRQVLRYEPETGGFYWIHRDTHKQKLGQYASIVRSNGYLNICIDGQYYYTHRLAWFYVHGEWPNIIDHINGEKFDNRIKNLRDVNTQTNLQNLKKAMVTNKSTGILGVRKLRGKFLAQITIEGKETHFGTFNSVEDAHAVYLQAKRRFHNGCTI